MTDIGKGNYTMSEGCSSRLRDAVALIKEIHSNRPRPVSK